MAYRHTKQYPNLWNSLYVCREHAYQVQFNSNVFYDIYLFTELI